MPKIAAFTVSPREISPGKHAKLAPKILTEDVEVKMTGITAEKANALRRVISNELPTKILLIDHEDIQTDDQYVFPNLLIDHVRCVPIMQSVKEGAEFTIEIKNNSAKYIDVLSGDFKPALPANPNIVLMHLDAGRYIRFKAVVTTVMGYRTESMPHIGVVACQCASVPSRPDLKMYDQYVTTSTTGDPFEADAVRGMRSGVNKETEYTLRFCSLGIMPAKDIFRAACETLIARLEKIVKIPITSAAGEHLLRVDDESATIGPLMLRAALAVDHSSNMVYNALTTMRSVEIRFKTGEMEPAELISASVEHLVKFYRALLAEV